MMPVPARKEIIVPGASVISPDRLSKAGNSQRSSTAVLAS
jgi:hypothetical protein